MNGKLKTKIGQMMWAVCIGVLVCMPISIPGANGLSNHSDIRAGNDLIVDTNVVLDRSTVPSGVFGIDGNITINSGGNLTVKNIEIQFLQDGGLYPVSPQKKYTLTINSGGVLYLVNSKITVSIMMVTPYLKFNLTVNGGKLIMENSELSYPGYLFLNNAELYANNSRFTGLNEMPAVWASDAAKIDDNDDGPVLTAINSNIYVADSTIDHYYENVNIMDYQLTPKDFSGFVDLGAGQSVTFSQFDTSDISYDKLSSVRLSVDYTTTVDYNGTASFRVSYNGGVNWQNLPITPQPDQQASETVPLAITTLAGISNLRFSFTHNGNSGNISIARFDVMVRPAYEFNITLRGSTLMTIVNSNVSIDWNSDQISFGVSNKLVLYDTAIVEMLNASFDEEETPPLDANGHGQKYAPAIITYNSSKAIIYRWAKIPVYDQNKMPIVDAQLVSLEYTPSSSMIQYNLSSDANNLNNHQFIKMYLTAHGITNRSDASGIITYPVASDVINITSMPNSIFIGTYIANCTYPVNKRGSGIISLPPYPDMVESDNAFTTSPVAISIDLPNLKITNLFSTPSQPLKGDVVNITARVENTGLATAKSVVVRFMVNGIVLGDSAPIDISQGGSANVPYPYIFDASGTASIVATVDPDNTVSEMDEGDNTYSTSFSIAGRPSLSIPFLFVLVSGSPSESVNVNQSAEIRATIQNNGDGVATNVQVEFRADGTVIGTDTISSIPIGDSRDAKINWMPTSGTGATITVSIIQSTPSESDLDKGDNSATKNVIITYPSLQVNTGSISFSSEPVENTTTTISAEIYNDGNGFASDVLVEFRNDTQTIGTQTITKIEAKSTKVASVVWNVPMGSGGTQNISVRVVSTHEGIGSQEVTAQVYVKYAPRVNMETKVYFYDTENNFINSAQVGSTVIFRLNLTNDGDVDSSQISVDFYLDSITKSSYIGKKVIQSVPGRGATVCEFSWSVQTKLLNQTHVIYARVNGTSMNASGNLFVEKLNVEWDVPPFLNLNYSTNTEYSIMGRVRTSMPVEMSIALNVKDANNAVVASYQGTFTDDSGSFVIPVKFDKSGKYTLEVVVSGSDINTISYTQPNVEISGPVQTGMPLSTLLIILVIIIIVVAVIVAFVAISRMGVGKLGECGECGAPIPENATKCPKCGAEFETNTVRCSECGAWIPANVKTCPECGTTFTGKKVEGTTYEKSMRQQYEAYVDKYRAQAKREMGASFNETAFWRWWRTQPSYMTYNQWLHKEEKEKKETKKCPSCGAINERTATVCYRCGTSLVPVQTTQEGRRYEPPREQPPQYTQPVYQQPPAPTTYQQQAYTPPPPPPAPREEPTYAPQPSRPVVLKSTPPPAAPGTVPPPAAPVPPKKVIKRPETVGAPEKTIGKVCPKCGKEISPEFVVCPYCGAIVH